MTKTLSLANFDDVSASETAYEFEVLKANGGGSGWFISVYGAESEVVTTAIAKLLDDQRKRDSNSAFLATRAGKPVDPTPIATDVEFGHKSAALRIAGWRGLDESFSPDLALKACAQSRRIAKQVTDNSDAIGNFTAF